ncbi:hypothetical protein [Priestia megaterium]
MFDDYKQPLIFLEALPLHRLLAIKVSQDGLRQYELAEIIGCSSGTISEVLKGKRRIPVKSIGRAKDYLYNDHYIDGVLQKDE